MMEYAMCQVRMDAQCQNDDRPQGCHWNHPLQFYSLSFAVQYLNIDVLQGIPLQIPSKINHSLYLFHFKIGLISKENQFYKLLLGSWMKNDWMFRNWEEEFPAGLDDCFSIVSSEL